MILEQPDGHLAQRLVPGPRLRVCSPQPAVAVDDRIVWLREEHRVAGVSEDFTSAGREIEFEQRLGRVGEAVDLPAVEIGGDRLDV